MPRRVQIGISFQYEVSAYASSSSGSFVSTAVTVLEPVVGTTVAITDRDTGNPATVYAAETGLTTISSPTTDAGGNVPGWVLEGSYTLQAAAIGGFTGATIHWEAVRGDGVGLIAPGAVDFTALADSVAQALVPVGTMLDFGGSSPPPSYLICDGSVRSQTTYANLFTAIGTTYNTGGEGTGNFRLPDTRQRFALGKASSGTGSTLGGIGGSIDHVHVTQGVSIPGLSIPGLGIGSLNVNSHSHALSADGGVQLAITRIFGGPTSLSGALSNAGNFVNTGLWSDDQAVARVWGFQSGVHPSSEDGFALYGQTDSSAGQTQPGTTAGGTTGGGTTGTGTTDPRNPPFIALNKIIKY